MKNRLLPVTAILFILSIGNLTRVLSDGNFRVVEFVSIFASGMFLGVLLMQIINKMVEKHKDELPH